MLGVLVGLVFVTIALFIMVVRTAIDEWRYTRDWMIILALVCLVPICMGLFWFFVWKLYMLFG